MGLEATSTVSFCAVFKTQNSSTKRIFVADKLLYLERIPFSAQCLRLVV
jgi:hypothetical protein